MSRPIKRRRDYRTRLTLQVLSGSTTPTSRGHSQRTYVDRIKGAYGCVEQASGREGVLAREIQPTATHFIETDFTPTANVKSRWKIEATGALLNILSLDNVEQRNRTLQCVCEERVST